jgi:endonuclease-3
MTGRGEARWARDRLVERFGDVFVPASDPVETLVVTILSQNTTDANRDRAYQAFVARFARCEDALGVDAKALAGVIRTAGLQDQKACAIQAALQSILARAGRLTLDFLRPLSTEQALSWLVALPGVGDKTAGVVLLFGLDKPYFPIDTHIRRVLSRVGWLKAGTDPHRQMNTVLPHDVELMRTLHLHLIRLGRTICRPRRPDCFACPLAERCVYASGDKTKQKEGISR